MPKVEDVIFQQLIRWYWSKIRHACLKDKGVVARRMKTVRIPDGVGGNWKGFRGLNRIFSIRDTSISFPNNKYILCWKLVILRVTGS